MPLDSDDLSNVGPLGALLSVRLRRTDLRLNEAFRRPAVRSELIVCLGVIASQPGVSQNEVARIIRSDASIVVGLVNQLEALGWAARRPSETDRRRHALYATPLGETELVRLTAEIKQAEDELLAHVDRAEIAYLEYLLDKIHASCRRAARTAGE